MTRLAFSFPIGNSDILVRDKKWAPLVQCQANISHKISHNSLQMPECGVNGSVSGETIILKSKHR